MWLALEGDYEVQLRYGLHLEGWNKGFDLTADTLAAIARLRARMVCDIYAYGEGD